MAKSTRNHGQGTGRFAANLFAATVVMTIGVGTCLMIVFASAPDASESVLLILGGMIGLIAVIWLLSGRGPHRALDGHLTIAEQREQMDLYLASFRPRSRRRRGRERSDVQPPSVDSLRQIREDSNAWRPSERRVEEYRKKLKGTED